MQRRFLYIINPISGTGNKKGIRELIEKKSALHNIPYQVFPSVASGDYSFLDPIIKENKITDVIIAGGDGTVSQVVYGLAGSNVNFGIIPCGSGNGLAFTAGIPKSHSKALDLLCTGNPAAADAFLINDHFACMLCGLGFDAKVAHDFARQPARGLATYIRQVIRNFFAAKTYPFVINVDGITLNTEAYFISIANSNQFGNNFRIAPEASLSDGLLDIVIVTSQSKLGLLLEVLKQVRGKNKLQPVVSGNTQKRIIYFQAAKLHIGNPAHAPLHIDGDPVETAENFRVAVQKRFFRLIQPKED